jgi:hypothetical protein
VNLPAIYYLFPEELIELDEESPAKEAEYTGGIDSSVAAVPIAALFYIDNCMSKIRKR